MTEIDDIVPSGSYLSAKVNRVGEVFVISAFGSEKSRFKEGQTNLVLTLTDSEGDEKKVTLNKQSRENLAKQFGRTLESWVGKRIEIGYIRPTAYGNTLDFVPSRDQTPATPKPEKSRTQIAIDLIEQAGAKGMPIKATESAFMAAFSVSEEAAQTIIQGLKNEGWIVEEKGKIRIA